jgi:hypothetical protein
MRIIRRFMCGVALTTALVAGAALVSSSANALTVNNFSFETLPAGGLTINCGIGCAYSQNDPIPGWTSTSDYYGQWQPGPYIGGFNSVPDGSTIAYSVDVGTFSQSIGTAVAGIIYTLQVDVGQRLDGQYTAPIVELKIGGTAFDVSGPTPASGGWANWTVSGSGNTGDSIAINLISNGQQADFDNVRLAAATPLPSTLLMLLSGFIGLGFFAYRGTKKGSAALAAA